MDKCLWTKENECPKSGLCQRVMAEDEDNQRKFAPTMVWPLCPYYIPIKEDSDK